MNKYNNKALSIQEQIERLKKNGLIIDDENQANKTLSIISYFRLASYWRPMEEKDQEKIGKWNRFGKHKRKISPRPPFIKGCSGDCCIVYSCALLQFGHEAFGIDDEAYMCSFADDAGSVACFHTEHELAAFDCGEECCCFYLRA